MLYINLKTETTLEIPDDQVLAKHDKAVAAGFLPAAHIDILLEDERRYRDTLNVIINICRLRGSVALSKVWQILDVASQALVFGEEDEEIVDG